MRLYVMRLQVDPTGAPRGGPITFPEHMTLAQWKSLPKSGMMRYGAEPAGLVAMDVTNAQHNAIKGFNDVQPIPTTFDTNLTTSAISAAETVFDFLFIPTGWLNTSRTYRDVVRYLAGMFSFNARFYSATDSNFVERASRNMEKTWAALPQDVRDDIVATMASMIPPLSSDGLNGASTVRDILKTMGQQFLSRELHLGGMVI